MKYKIVTKSNKHRIESEVNELISKGWKPIGGVSYSDELDEYNQAMIMETITCSRCLGESYYSGGHCETCNGKGVIYPSLDQS